MIYILEKRAQKSGLLNYILGVVAIVAGIVLAPVTGGASLGLLLMATGFGISQIATGLKKDQMAKVYGELYDAGLKKLC